MRTQLGNTAVNQLGVVLWVWKRKRKLKLKYSLEEDLIGPADYKGLGHKEASMAGQLGVHGTTKGGNWKMRQLKE